MATMSGSDALLWSRQSRGPLSPLHAAHTTLTACPARMRPRMGCERAAESDSARHALQTQADRTSKRSAAGSVRPAGRGHGSAAERTPGRTAVRSDSYATTSLSVTSRLARAGRPAGGRGARRGAGAGRRAQHPAARGRVVRHALRAIAAGGEAAPVRQPPRRRLRVRGRLRVRRVARLRARRARRHQALLQPLQRDVPLRRRPCALWWRQHSARDCRPASLDAS